MSTTSAASSWPANGLISILDFASASHKRALGVLLIVCVMLFLPGFFQIPPVDRDEAYFAQATKQMIETGDYVDIRYQDDVRYRKPVGIYWLQAVVVKTAQALGDPGALTTIWLYRIPSLIGAVGAVMTTYWCALAFVSRRGAVLASIMLAASTLLGVEARLAKTDAILLFTIVAAMAVLARAYLTPRDAGNDRLDWKLLAIFWTALAVGILIKGPVNLMVVGLAALTLSIFERSGRWLLALRPLVGVAWLFLIVLPWFVAIYARVGTAFFADAIGHDMLGKVASAQETHGAPPGLYFLLFFATFYPGSILAGLAAPAVWRVRREPAAKFLLAWLVPSWIVFELVVTKLPHYVLPLYPAIAILIAGAVESKVLSQRPWLVRGAVWWFIAPILISAAVVTLAIVVARDPAFPAWPFFALAMVCGLFAWLLYQPDGAELSMLRVTIAAVLMAIGVFSITLPWLRPAFPSVTLANILHRANCVNPIAASAGYEEPSLVFLAGTDIRFTDASSAADFLLQGSCRFAFIEARQERAFAFRAEAIGLRYERETTVQGYNIANGKPVDISVFQSAGNP
jgi:4-amino-4-deoxy-L-arabinose transferase-like glycosyltransferase